MTSSSSNRPVIKRAKTRKRFRSNNNNGNVKNPNEISASEVPLENNTVEPEVSEQDAEAHANKPIFQLSTLREMHISALITLAEESEIENPARLHTQELIFLLLKHYAHIGYRLFGKGVLDVSKEGFGFIRYADQSFVPGASDIYVAHNQINRLRLLNGDVIEGEIRTPRDRERFCSLVKVETVNGLDTSGIKRRILFDNFTPLFPTTAIKLERDLRANENTTSRVIDIIAPIGKGQRGLLVAPPKSGKTVILQQIAHAIEDNYPDIHLIVLLVDERPEEVTEMKRSVRGSVFASTFDESASQHVHVAEMVIEHSKRLVEQKKDVVILLDSITRLARAYNTIQPTSGRVLTGGVDSQALQRPKRFFGAARNIEEGGSLTILATALIETGSKMDDVIYEEFKGTGNMELHLDRKIAEKRTYPAISLLKSGTRREELLLDEQTLKSTWVLRKALASMDEESATEFLLDKMRRTSSNEEFFNLMKKGG